MILNIIVSWHAPAYARHTWGVPWQLMKQCTKYLSVDTELVRVTLVSLYESYKEFSSLSRGFTVEQGKLSKSLYCFCMFWPHNFAIFHI